MTELGAFPGIAATDQPDGPPPSQAASRKRRGAGPSGGGHAGGGVSLTVAQLADLLAETFGLVSLILGMAVGLRALAMTEYEARAIAGPASRILARSKWYRALMRRLGRAAADTPDVWALVLALTAYALRVADEMGARLPFVRREAAIQATVQRNNAIMRDVNGAVADGSMGHSQADSGPGGHPSAAPRESSDIHVFDGLFSGEAYRDIPLANHPLS